ncbi:MAG: GNAT family N-acetyltransferase [Clostridia bacterium]|nr:GNAT family N-acetyltransferase [Clostridia bacterium]
MHVELRERTERHVRIHFEKTRDDEIQKMCPQRAQTLTEAIADYRRSAEPGSASFGRTVYADGEYVGDIWCFAMHEEDDPDAMLSYCLFEKAAWGKGIATEAVRLFAAEISVRFSIRRIGAFTYLDNAGSVRVLEKNGFVLREIVEEDGVKSAYYTLDVEEEV